MKRRSFLQAALAAFPFAALGRSLASQTSSGVHAVGSGEERFSEAHPTPYSSMKFKVATQDANGGLLVIEHNNLQKGGPPRHLHYEQEEWFYMLEGEMLIEVGQERMRLNPGDSVCAPRNVPHVWAYVGDKPGKLLIGFAPAGKMEEFFREVTKPNAPPMDAKLFSSYGMEHVGPPLSLP